MTNIPTNDSRVTRLRRSTSFCTTLKRGRTMENSTKITPRMTSTARAMSQLMEGLFPTALMTPPMPWMGA